MNTKYTDYTGKFVKLRDGKKAYVLGVLPDEIKKSFCEGLRIPQESIKDYSHFIGYTFLYEKWVPDDWKQNGRAFTFQGSGDIVGLWDSEPAPDKKN
jgi:hypothetical protein